MSLASSLHYSATCVNTATSSGAVHACSMAKTDVLINRGLPEVVNVTSKRRICLLKVVSKTRSPHARLDRHGLPSFHSVSSVLSPLSCEDNLESSHKYQCASSTPNDWYISTDLRSPPTPFKGKGSLEKRTFVSEGRLTAIASSLALLLGARSRMMSYDSPATDLFRVLRVNRAMLQANLT